MQQRIGLGFNPNPSKVATSAQALAAFTIASSLCSPNCLALNYKSAILPSNFSTALLCVLTFSSLNSLRRFGGDVPVDLIDHAVKKENKGEIRKAFIHLIESKVT